MFGVPAKIKNVRKYKNQRFIKKIKIQRLSSLENTGHISVIKYKNL